MSAQYKTSTTVARAFAILDLLASNPCRTVSLSQVSAQLKVSKSTAHRYLVTLEELGVVQRDGSDSFVLGHKLIELAGVFLSEYDLRKESNVFLEKLSSATQETVHLAIPAGTDVIYIAKVDSPHSVRLASHIGARGPMFCTALGKAILAFLEPDIVEQVIANGLSRRTSSTIVTPQGLRKELARVRRQGYAIDDQENEIDVRCVGAPIFDYMGKAIGALSVSGPSSRVSMERLGEFAVLVRSVGLEISARMGYQPQDRRH